MYKVAEIAQYSALELLCPSQVFCQVLVLNEQGIATVK